MVRWFTVFVCALTLAAAPATRPATQPAAMENVNGAALPPEQRFPQQEFVRRWRPWELADHKGTLLIQNLNIHDALNQRAMDIVLTSPDRPTPSQGEPLTYGKVIIRNCETADIKRDETGRQQSLHIDHIRMMGGGNQQPFETEVVLEDIYIHGGDALPLLIGEGKYSRITLRRVKIENSHNGGAQITAIAVGSIAEVVVDESPGLNVSLIGRAGSIKRCIVLNSPGAMINDVATAVGKSGAAILTGEAAIAAAGSTGESPSKLATTRPVARSAAPPKFVVTPDADGKTLHLALEGDLGQEVAFVTFEAADRLDYRIGQPVIITEAPWKTDLRPGKKGQIILRAMITRIGGDPDIAIIHPIDLR